MALDFISNPAHKVRLLIGDVSEVPSEQLFSDVEIQGYLSLVAFNVYAAAALALGTIVISSAKLAKVIEREGYKTERHAVSELLKVQATMNANAITAEGLQTSEFAITDEHMESWRPSWQSVTDVRYYP